MIAQFNKISLALFCSYVAWVGPAAADCYVEEKTGKTICLRKTASGGPIGPSFNRINPELLSRLLEHNDLMIGTVEVQGEVSAEDKETARLLLEEKRQRLEVFRRAAEAGRTTGDGVLKYNSDITAYKNGIDSYKLDVRGLK